jgi:hypothetical protein
MKPVLPAAALAAVLLLTSCVTAVREGTPETRTKHTEFQAGKAESIGAEEAMEQYDFTEFPNVTVTGADLSGLGEAELSLLYAQARYCQAMTDEDIDTLRELVSEDMVFTHMSGRKQTREEYFADVADGSLNYFIIGIENPVIEADGDKARITYTSVLNAEAYGARGTYRIKGTHHYALRDGCWMLVNG